MNNLPWRLEEGGGKNNRRSERGEGGEREREEKIQGSQGNNEGTGRRERLEMRALIIWNRQVRGQKRKVMKHRFKRALTLPLK